MGFLLLSGWTKEEPRTAKPQARVASYTRVSLRSGLGLETARPLIGRAGKRPPGSSGRECFSSGEERGEGSARRLEQRGVGPSLPSEPPPRARGHRRPLFQTGRLSLPRWKASRVDAQSGGRSDLPKAVSRPGRGRPQARPKFRSTRLPRRKRRPEGGGAPLRAPGNPEAPAFVFFPTPLSRRLRT